MPAERQYKSALYFQPAVLCFSASFYWKGMLLISVFITFFAYIHFVVLPLISPVIPGILPASLNPFISHPQADIAAS